jgi:aspartokinase/homoserine dehydrogenase 1
MGVTPDSNMRNIHIVQLGYGTIGKELYRQISHQHEKLRSVYGIELTMRAVATSKELTLYTEGRAHRTPYANWDQMRPLVKEFPHTIVVDVTAAPLADIHQEIIAGGGALVTSNKKPITNTMETYRTLHADTRRYRYETTVGAGLPVISTLQDLLETGDEIEEIQGALSGTLGYVCSELEQQKKSFSQIVAEAKEKGFTEPHPQDDLGGIDVARKALILAREIGLTMEMPDIPVTGLTPQPLADIKEVDEYMEKLKTLDREYADKTNAWKKEHKVPRFVARITRENVNVGLEGILADSSLGRLQGPDNLIVLKTKRYHDRPLAIQGPGAGAEVTAAGVFADLLKVCNVLQ